MKKITITKLNMAYFHTYHMSYDLIATYIRQEMNIANLHMQHFSDPKSLLTAAAENSIDVIIINSSCLFNGPFGGMDLRNMLMELCENKNITMMFFAQNMKAALLRKILDAGVDIIISSQDKPQELVASLMSVMMSPPCKPYISRSVREDLKENFDELTAKEREVFNLIQEGYSPSEIASKKFRSLSTISTQKRNAMNKLNLRNENELLHFLHQNTFF